VKPSNVDEFAFAPVMAGFWKQHELFDGTYTVDDLLDIHEMMLVQEENAKLLRQQGEF
jgi:hypothetical protein